MRTGIRLRRGSRGNHQRARALVATLAVAAVLQPTSVAVAEPTTPATTAAEQADTYPHTPLWVYGHSFTTSPGTMTTPGREWMPDLAAELGQPRWRTFGVASSRLIDTFGDISRSAPRGSAANSDWDPARRGVVVLQSEFNDMINPAPTAAVRSLPLSTRAAGNYGQTLQACLAILSSSSRADWSSSRGSRGWTSARGSAYLGGSLVYTTTPGAYREMTVDVGASGTVWLVSWEVSRSVRNPRTGATAISVDGRLRHTIPPRTTSWDSIYSRRSGGFQHTVGPRATKISGLTPGRHVIRVAKADRGPGAVYLDQLLVQSDAPVPVVVLKDPVPLASGTSAVTGPANRSMVIANRRQLHPQIDSVVQQFPNVVTVSLDLPRPEYFGRDGVHPSDAGMLYEADLVAQRFREFARAYDVAVMYE